MAPRRWPLVLLGAAGAGLVAFASDLPGSPYGAGASGVWPLAATTTDASWQGPRMPRWPMIPNMGPGVGPGRLLAAAAVLTGIGMLLVAWALLWRQARRRQLNTPGGIGWIVGSWIAPLFLSAPLGSRDVWLYGAQGRALASGLGGAAPAQLLGHSIWLAGVYPGWAARPPLYGPGALDLSALFVRLSTGRPWVAVELWRLAVVVSLLLAGWGVACIVSLRGGNAPAAIVAAVANPAVLVVLVAGVHNDALVMGLVTAGVAMACSRRPGWALLLCSAAVTVKAPAALALGAVAWWCCERWGRTRAALLAAGSGIGALIVTGIGAGGGFEWLRALHSYAGVVGAWSFGAQFLQLFSPRALDAVELAGAALAVGVVLRTRPADRGVAALGWAFLLVALTAPNPQPWYLAWALGLLAGAGAGAGKAQQRVKIGVGVVGAMMLASVTPAGLSVWFVGAVALAFLTLAPGRDRSGRQRVFEGPLVGAGHGHGRQLRGHPQLAQDGVHVAADRCL